MKKHHLYLILEFFVVGILLGIVEDLIAIKFSTDAVLTWKTVGIAALVAFPFAFFSEIIVDQARIKQILKKEEEKLKEEIKKVEKVF